jgi:hypothetical protein
VSPVIGAQATMNRNNAASTSRPWIARFMAIISRIVLRHSKANGQWGTPPIRAGFSRF